MKVITKLENLQQKLGYAFKNTSLLVQALTHQSYANDMGTISYERLEFLGDSIIQVVVSDYIFNNIIVDAGTSTKLRASLVSTNYLSQVSILLGLDKIAFKSKSLQQLGKKNIADLFESVVGAIYIDGGLDIAREIINKFVIISEENVGSVYLNKLLLRMFSATLRRNIRNSTLQNLQKCLLNTLTADITGY